jgi:CRP/FNR family transcriptional regulator, cyclic AMP receptor protein
MPEAVRCIFHELCPGDTVLIKASPGRTIFSPSQRADFIYHLHAGVVAGVYSTKNGKEMTASIYLPKQLIGIAGFARLSTEGAKFHIGEARAVTAATYCKVRSDVVFRLLDDPKARAEIFGLLCSRMVGDAVYTTLSLYQDIATRLICLLRLLGRFIGRYDERGQVIIQGISHDDIASLANTSRPTVTHILDKMQSKGIIRIEQKKIVFLCDYESMQVDMPDALQREFLSKPLP